MALIDSNPLHFTCAKCGARPYDPCKDSRGRTMNPHKERARIYGRRSPEVVPEEPPVIPDNVTEAPNHKPTPTDEPDIGG